VQWNAEANPKTDVSPIAFRMLFQWTGEGGGGGGEKLKRPSSRDTVLKPNSLTYDFVEVSGHNHQSSQVRFFRIQCLRYKPVLTTSAREG
jgi:hypothetical protein